MVAFRSRLEKSQRFARRSRSQHHIRELYYIILAKKLIWLKVITNFWEHMTSRGQLKRSLPKAEPNLFLKAGDYEDNDGKHRKGVDVDPHWSGLSLEQGIRRKVHKVNHLESKRQSPTMLANPEYRLSTCKRLLCVQLHGFFQVWKQVDESYVLAYHSIRVLSLPSSIW